MKKENQTESKKNNSSKKEETAIETKEKHYPTPNYSDEYNFDIGM